MPTQTPALSPEALEALLSSEKFRAWKPTDVCRFIVEKHYTPQELAESWGVSIDLVRDIFRDVDGVLIVQRPSTRTKRAYSTMRIPQSVVDRVYNQLSKR